MAEERFTADPSQFDAAEQIDGVLRKLADADREANWNRIVDRFPASVPASTYLGLALTQSGKFAQAIDALQDALNGDPGNPRISEHLADAWIAHGQDLLTRKSWDDAMSAFLSAAALRPGDPAARQGQASVMVAQGNIAGVRQLYEAAISLEPESFAYYQQLDEILRGENLRAERLDAWTARVAADPLNPLSYVMLAQTRYEQGDLQGALEAFQAGAEHDTGQIHLESRIGMVYQKMAEQAEHRGELENALSRYDQALEMQPDQAAAQQGKARTLQALGRADEARDIFQALIVGQPDNYTWYTGLDEIWKALPPDQRIDEWTDLAHRFPTIVWPHYFLGGALIGAERTDEGILAINKARELAPNNPQVINGLAEIYLKTAEEKLGNGQPREAVENFDALLQIRPTDQRGMLGRARALMAAGNEKAASEAYMSLILANDGYALACRELSEYYTRTKTPDEIVAAWRSMVAKDPNIARVQQYLAQALVQSDHIDEAVEAYQAAAQVAGNDRVLLVEVSRALVQMEAWQAGHEILSRAIAANPTLTGLRLDQLRCLVELDRAEEAQQLRGKLIQDGIEIPAELQ